LYFRVVFISKVMEELGIALCGSVSQCVDHQRRAQWSGVAVWCSSEKGVEELGVTAHCNIAFYIWCSSDKEIVDLVDAMCSSVW